MFCSICFFIEHENLSIKRYSLDLIGVGESFLGGSLQRRRFPFSHVPQTSFLPPLGDDVVIVLITNHFDFLTSIVVVLVQRVLLVLVKSRPQACSASETIEIN